MTSQQRLSNYMGLKSGGRRAYWWVVIHQGDGDCELSQPELKGYAAYASGVHAHSYPVTVRQRRRLMHHADAADRCRNRIQGGPGE